MWLILHHVLYYLLFSVEEIHDNVEDLEKSSDDIHYDNGVILLQSAVKQPAQVTVETGAALGEPNWTDRCRLWTKAQKTPKLLQTRGEKGEKLDVVCTFGFSHFLQVGPRSTNIK